MLTSDCKYKVGDLVRVVKPFAASLRTEYHNKFVGKSGEVVMVGLDNSNNWVIDLLIDGVKETSFRLYQIEKGL